MRCWRRGLREERPHLKAAVKCDGVIRRLAMDRTPIPSPGISSGSSADQAGLTVGDAGPPEIEQEP